MKTSKKKALRSPSKKKWTRANRNSEEAAANENSEPYDEIGKTEEEIRQESQEEIHHEPEGPGPVPREGS